MRAVCPKYTVETEDARLLYFSAVATPGDLRLIAEGMGRKECYSCHGPIYGHRLRVRCRQRSRGRALEPVPRSLSVLWESVQCTHIRLGFYTHPETCGVALIGGTRPVMAGALFDCPNAD